MGAEELNCRHVRAGHSPAPIPLPLKAAGWINSDRQIKQLISLKFTNSQKVRANLHFILKEYVRQI